MKHNIIAVFVFIGFIATVFTLGYVTSRDTMPMYRGHIPDINTTGSQSINRNTANDGLSVSSVSSPQMGSATGGYSGNSRSSQYSQGGTSASGGIATTSSQTLHSYGGGSIGGGIASSGGTKSGVSTRGISDGGSISMPSLAFDRRDRTKTISENTPTGILPYEVNAPRFGSFDDDDPEPGDRPGPYQNPVGDAPIGLVLLMIGLYAAIKTLRIRLE